MEIPRDIRDIGLTRKQEDLEWRKVNEDDAEPSTQLLWMLHMDELMLEAIGHLFHSPFRPAPILAQLRMEFNIFKIDHFREWLHGLLPVGGIELPFDLDFKRSKLRRGMLVHFNNHVINKVAQQANLALRFQRARIGRDKADRLFKQELKFVHKHPGLKMRTFEEIQEYKQKMGLPDFVEAKRDISMQLYLPHDVTKVSRYFYNPDNVPGFVEHCRRIVKHQYETARQLDSFSTYEYESEQEEHPHHGDDST